MSEDSRRATKVGLLTLSALVVLGVGIFLIGERNNLFSLKNRYYARFTSVSGLNEGSPVQLNGVKVGTVKDVELPEDPGETRIRVEISVDGRYAERLRADSGASIKTIGLLGDKYVELTSGTPEAAVLEPGSEIPASNSSMDALVASSEDVMANVTGISTSLKVILERIERGEGLMGEMLSDTETGAHVSDKLVATLDSVQHVAQRIETGEGVLPRLISDAAMADRFVKAVEHLEAVTSRIETGDGLIPSLLSDAKMKQDFHDTVLSLKTAANELSTMTREIKAGKGLLPRLMFDEQYGEKVSGEIQTTVERVDSLAQKLDGSQGTLSRLINDPSIYEAMQDIVVGVNESRMLRWLLRNRQKAGIEKRYEDTQKEGPPAEALPAEPPPASM